MEIEGGSRVGRAHNSGAPVGAGRMEDGPTSSLGRILSCSLLGDGDPCALRRSGTAESWLGRGACEGHGGKRLNAGVGAKSEQRRVAGPVVTLL